MRAETDNGQATTNPHLLAARIIKRGGPITHSDINAVLESQGFSITAEELEELKSLEKTSYSMSTLLDLSSPGRIVFNRLCPEKGSKAWGVYIYTNLKTNVQYVGSSMVLGERLRHY